VTTKQFCLKALAIPGVTKTLSRLTGCDARIFLLHRFEVRDLGVTGLSAGALRRTLAYLRRARYDLLSLEELLGRLRTGRSVHRAVVMTIDDGYFDTADVAAPIFEEYGCPVTCFLATGFLDGRLWLWWDRLKYIFEHTTRTQLTAHVGAEVVPCAWQDFQSRRMAWWHLNVQCQNASQADRLACVEALAREAEVDLPSRAPAAFAPMTWDTARRLESRGFTFGPHTVTHPVLASTDPDQAFWEIEESWRRLRAELAHPIPVFAYPNGRDRDAGDREVAMVRRAGLEAALLAVPSSLDPAAVRRSPSALYRLPRFGYTDHLEQVLQCISGLEEIKTRRRLARWQRLGVEPPEPHPDPVVV
jgi:peptidoglycan/xylan/chitin deacetylase (PgdA/CDA1 family)